MPAVWASLSSIKVTRKVNRHSSLQTRRHGWLVTKINIMITLFIHRVFSHFLHSSIASSTAHRKSAGTAGYPREKGKEAAQADRLGNGSTRAGWCPGRPTSLRLPAARPQVDRGGAPALCPFVPFPSLQPEQLGGKSLPLALSGIKMVPRSWPTALPFNHSSLSLRTWVKSHSFPWPSWPCPPPQLLSQPPV